MEKHGIIVFNLQVLAQNVSNQDRVDRSLKSFIQVCVDCKSIFLSSIADGFASPCGSISYSSPGTGGF